MSIWALNEFVTSSKMNIVTDGNMTAAAQNAYQTLQANNIFDNKDYLAAEEFTDSTGTNNTINTGSTSALFNTDHYELNGTETVDGTTYQINPVGTNCSGWSSPVDNAFDSDDATYTTATMYGYTTTSGELGKTFSDQYVKTITYKIRERHNTSNNYRVAWFSVWYKDTSDTWNLLYTMPHTTPMSSGVTWTGEATVNAIARGIKIIAHDGGGGSDYRYIDVYKLEYKVPNTSDTVICDTATLTLDGTESNICVYGDVDLPTNTSMTVDVSDGTTTVSAQGINTPIDISSLSSGTLKLTFNLATTDTTVTPSFYGWGVFLK